jgi:hypothetical protein
MAVPWLYFDRHRPPPPNRDGAGNSLHNSPAISMTSPEIPGIPCLAGVIRLSRRCALSGAEVAWNESATQLSQWNFCSIFCLPAELAGLVWSSNGRRQIGLPRDDPAGEQEELTP